MFVRFFIFCIVLSAVCFQAAAQADIAPIAKGGRRRKRVDSIPLVGIEFVFQVQFRGVGMGEGCLCFFPYEVGRAVIVAAYGLEIIAGAGVAIAKLGFQRGISAGAVQHVQG